MSHSTRVRELKYIVVEKNYIVNESHSTRVRELKFIKWWITTTRRLSHSTRVRELKLISAIARIENVKQQTRIYDQFYLNKVRGAAYSLKLNISLKV